MVSLDIGCGRNKKEGCIGLDLNGSLEGVDVVHEINRRAYIPFRDNTFEEIYISDVVEHVDDVPWLMSEVHRIARPEATIHIQYPHYTGRNAYGDVTHKRWMGGFALDHFIPATEYGDKYRYYTMFGRHFPFRIKTKRFSFKIREIGDILSKVFGTEICEKYLSAIIPISTVNLELRVLKE